MISVKTVVVFKVFFHSWQTTVDYQITLILY